MIVESSALVGDVVDLHRPRTDFVIGLLHELDVFRRRRGDEEIVGDLVCGRISRDERIVFTLHLDERVHARLGHIVKAAPEELGRLLVAEETAVLGGQTRLDHTRDGGLAEHQQSLLLFCHLSLLHLFRIKRRTSPKAIDGAKLTINPQISREVALAKHSAGPCASTARSHQAEKPTCQLRSPSSLRIMQSMALYDQVPIIGSLSSSEHDVRQFTLDSHMPPSNGARSIHSGCHHP